MKKTIITGALSTIIAMSAITAPIAEDINTTAVAGHPPVFRWVKHLSNTFIPAVDEALKDSGTTLKWSEQYGGSLAKVGDALEAIEEGLAEIGIVSSLFEASKLAEQNVTYFTPFVSADASKVGELMDKLHKEIPELRAAWEENGLEYLGGAIAIDDYLLMTKFPIETIADLEGKKIGAPGPAVNWLKGTGAVGVSGNLTTYYNEIKTGVYDGVIVFASAAVPAKLYEVAPYITKVGFGAQYAGGIAANKDWFDGLSADVQQALRDAATKDGVAYSADLDETVEKFMALMVSKGATVKEVGDNFRKEWAAGMDNVAKVWAEALDAQGKPGTKVLKIYMDSMRDAGATPIRNWDQE